MISTTIQLTSADVFFDCNQPVSLFEAQRMHAFRYTGVLRYLQRAPTLSPNDLSFHEVQDLGAAGLKIMGVQHVQSVTSWVPNQALGSLYGIRAASHAARCGLAKGSTIWCDLEGVATATTHVDVIKYGNAWYDAVLNEGFQPGLYVGWHCQLTPQELGLHLKFEHYWAAYNLNVDQYPTPRGVQMKQHAAKAGDVPPNSPLTIDWNTIQPDLKGGLPFATVLS